MKTYTDKYGRWHDKETINEEPSSNNGWIFTAYAKMLGIPIPLFPSYDCYLDCKITCYPLKIDRTPGKKLPPISRDEILGLVALDYLPIDYLQDSHWQFCNLDGFEPKPLWRVNWFKALASAWRIRKAHRNALWEEKDLWYLGFRLPPQDTWYVLKRNKIKPSLIHSLYFYLSSLHTVYRGSDSGKLILWMKLTDLGMSFHWMIDKMNMPLVFRRYFGSEHPFSNLAG